MYCSYLPRWMARFTAICRARIRKNFQRPYVTALYVLFVDIYRCTLMPNFQISLRFSWYGFKPWQESARIECRDMLSKGTVVHPVQNMHSPFSCRIFKGAFNNSSMPIVAGLLATLSSILYAFPVAYRLETVTAMSITYNENRSTLFSDSWIYWRCPSKIYVYFHSNTNSNKITIEIGYLIMNMCGGYTFKSSAGTRAYFFVERWRMSAGDAEELMETYFAQFSFDKPELSSISTRGNTLVVVRGTPVVT